MSEEEIKQEIEQVGYKEFYRYYNEKDILINKYKEVLDKIKEYCELNKEFTPRLEDILELLEEIE